MKRSSTFVSGFVTFGLIRLLLPLVLLWLGGQGVYTAVRNRQPYSATYSEYVQTKSDKEWVELKETRLSVVEAITSEKHGTIDEVYIPLRAPGAAAKEPVHALLLTRDPDVIGLVKMIRGLRDEKAVIEFAAKNQKDVFPTRTVTGLVQIGMDSDDRKRGKIQKLDINLSDGYVVIEEGKKPQPLLAIGFLLGAFPAAWLCWFRSRA